MPNRYNDHAQPDDALALLKEDHRRVRDLFQEYQAATDPRTKRELAEEACLELETHAQLEEQIFYPAVNEESDEGAALVQEALQEHQQVKDLIAALREMGPDHHAFDATFRELMQNIEHHVQEEESQMFPLAEQDLAEDLDELKDEMQDLKKALLAS
jgi:iron-sulfur cluster repair protein YtfE (RIC family)